MNVDIKKFTSLNQQADVCVLFSYWRFLQYFNVGLSFHAFCKYYIRYINDECDILNHSNLHSYITQEISVQNNNKKKDLTNECKILFENNLAEKINNIRQLPLEILTYAVLHCYCIDVKAHMKGLYHITILHDTFSQQQGSLFRIPNSSAQFTENQNDIEQNIQNLQSGIVDFLIILFQNTQGRSGGHTICLVNYNHTMYVGDPNLRKFMKESEYKKQNISPRFDINKMDTMKECISITINSNENEQ